MKKTILISLLFIVMSFIVFSASYFNEQNLYYNKLASAGEQIHDDFVVRDFVFAKNNKSALQIYSDLETVLKDFKANLYTSYYSEVEITLA